MNLYLISQVEVDGYETYDSAVVCAESSADAAATHPCGNNETGWSELSLDDWCDTPERVNVKLIGTATPSIEPGVVCASYNAG